MVDIASEEKAAFLETRGHCLLDNGRLKKAVTAYRAARKVAVGCLNYAQSTAYHARGTFDCSGEFYDG